MMPAPVTLDNLPAPLRDLERWVLFRIQTREGKPTKVPYQASGAMAKSTEPLTWASFETVIHAYAAGRFDGVGFVFAPGDDLTGIDLDHCAENGVLEGWAQTIIDSFASYAEFSVSGTGVHILIRGQIPDGLKGKRKGAIECYSEARYFTVSGRPVPGTPNTIEQRQDELDAFYRRVFAEPEKPTARQPASPASISLSDGELLDKALSAQDGGKFCRLWNGETSDFGGDDSSADLSLCCKLAFWFDRDESAIERLFRQSGLYREKWDRADYRERTISKALAVTVETYRPGGISPAQAQRKQRSYAAAAHPPNQGVSQTEDPPRPKEIVAQQPFELSDLGNGERLVHYHGDDLRYSYERTAWLIYADSHWEWDLTGEVYRRAKDSVRKIYVEAAAEPDADRSKALGKHALRSQSNDRLRSMVAQAQSEPSIPVRLQDLDADPWLLNCLNGALDLRTGQLRKHRREDYATKASPVAYDSAATCPKWLAFLNKVLPNGAAGGDNPNSGAEIRSYVQKAVGYSLTGDIAEQCLFFLFGHGRNGKSTFSETVSALLGEYWGKTRAETLMQKRDGGIPNDVAALMGLRLVTVSEVNQGQHLNEALVKDLTGGDTISARFMRGEFFNFSPSFKIWLYGNHKPTIKGTDTGIWRRLRLIPFTVQIPEAEVNPNLLTELREELPGILRWAVEGCLLWQKEGLGVPAEVRDATAAYRSEMDVIGAFLEDQCVIGDGLSALAGSLYAEYNKWCEQNGERAHSQRVFGTALGERGCERTRVNTGNKWKGVGLKSDGIMPELVPPLTPRTVISVPLNGQGVPCVPDSDITELLLEPRKVIPKNGTQGTQHTPQGTQLPVLDEDTEDEVLI